MKMRIFVILLLTVTSVSCFAQTRSSETKKSTFEDRYRNDPRPVCQNKPFNETSYDQIERDLIKTEDLRISHGRPAVRNEFPYATVLFKNDETDSDIPGKCGSTLITDQHVLTARHCLKKKKFDDVDMSISEFDLRRDELHFIRRSSGFSKGVGDKDDIAIIELAHPVTFGENKVINRDVYVADLPGPDYVVKENETMSIFGWGKTSQDGNTSMILKTINVRLSNQTGSDCNESFICVGGPHPFESPCGGDSGSGLIYRDYGKEVVVGVLSQTLGNCSFEHIDSQFMRVSAYAEYIYKHTLVAGCKPSFVF